MFTAPSGSQRCARVRSARLWARVQAMGLVTALCAALLIVAGPTAAHAAYPAALAAGSLPPGGTAYPVPAGAVFVDPARGSDLNSGSVSRPMATVTAAIGRAPVGGTVVLRAGTYHQSVVITKRVTIQAYPREAVWFDGTVPVTKWAPRGSTWVHSGWNVQFDDNIGFTKGRDDTFILSPGYPLAAKPDQVYYNGKQLAQVSPGAVRSGTFAVDYSREEIVMGNTPVGAAVRAADLPFALRANVPGVVLRGFGVRRYGGSITQYGMVRFNEPGSAENLVVEDAATIGISFSGKGVRANRLTVTRAGMVGVHGDKLTDMVFTNSLVTQNNRERFHPWHTAAGIKITRSTNLTFNDNRISSNYANGLWFDMDCYIVNVSRNLVENNSEDGIELELSPRSGIVGNTVVGGLTGIYIFDSGQTRIYNNAVGGQRDQSILLSQDDRRQTNPALKSLIPYLLYDVTVANNILASGAKEQIRALDKRTNIPADAMKIGIAGNWFATGTTMVAWGGANNAIAQRFTTVAALRAKNAGWINAQTTAGSVAELMARPKPTATAVPLRSDVAAMLQAPSGAKIVGPLR